MDYTDWQCSLGEDECRIVLDVLVDTAYLRETAEGKITLGYRVAA